MKQQLKKIGFVMVCISLLASLVVAGFRIHAESGQRTLQIAMRYGDVLQIAAHTKSTYEDVLKDFKALGVTTLIARENTLLSPIEGAPFGDAEQGCIVVSEQADQTYRIAIQDENTMQRIIKHLTDKGIDLHIDKEEDTAYIELTDKEVLYTIGTGFIEADLSKAADLGYSISPEVRYWEAQTDESILAMVEELRTLPNLSYIYFEDQIIPGYANEVVATLIKDYGLGFVEFYSPGQVGFQTLARASKSVEGHYQMVRMFTDEKVTSISTPDRVARYALALRERGLRVFTFILPEGSYAVEAVAQLEADISAFKMLAEAEGFTVSGEPLTYHYTQMGPVLMVLLGLGTVGIVLILLGRMGFNYVAYGVSSLLLVGYSIGIGIRTDLSLQVMAFITSVVFPIYTIVSQVKEQKMGGYGYAIRTFLKICGITFIGCLSVAALLSQANYALGIDGFRGVKLAHIIPLGVVMLWFIYVYRHEIKLEMKQFLQTKVSYKPILMLLAVIIVGGIFVIYIMRTGNGEISTFEKVIRQGLNDLLGVRPRTKEFLIGHPVCVVLLYFGFKGMYWPFLLVATIGQISLINTYAHIHTPLKVSLIRSAYGIGIGIIIGIILIEVVKFIFKVINKWIIKQK